MQISGTAAHPFSPLFCPCTYISEPISGSIVSGSPKHNATQPKNTDKKLINPVPHHPFTQKKGKPNPFMTIAAFTLLCKVFVELVKFVDKKNTSVHFLIRRLILFPHLSLYISLKSLCPIV